VEAETKVILITFHAFRMFDLISLSAAAAAAANVDRIRKRHRE
jgi:hypothetical protein